MKKFFLLNCLFLVIGLLTSCQKDNEVYSCNEDIDKWVNDNLADIKSMSRSEWKNLDERVKLATYRAFSPQQKTLFWKEKLNETLKLDWSTEEQSHLCLLIKFIDENPLFFDTKREKTEEEIEETDVFIYKWIEKAKSQLGWDMQLIASIASSGNKLVDKTGKVELAKTRIILKNTTRGSQTEPCDCEVAQIIRWCVTMDCGTPKEGCDNLDSGCGWLLGYKCDGTCGGV